MLLLLAILAPPAAACSIMPDAPFEPEEDPSDVEAPLEPLLAEVDVHRGRGPQEVGGCGGGAMSTSCDDIGTITLTFAQPAEDAHLAEELGYRIALVEGELPTDLTLAEGTWHGPDRHLTWIDGATDDQEPFDFTLEVTAVDAAGNESPPALVTVEDDPALAQPATCATSAGPSAGWPLLLIALGVRRRGPSPAPRGRRA